MSADRDAWIARLLQGQSRQLRDINDSAQTPIPMPTLHCCRYDVQSLELIVTVNQQAQETWLRLEARMTYWVCQHHGGWWIQTS